MAATALQMVAYLGRANGHPELADDPGLARLNRQMVRWATHTTRHTSTHALCRALTMPGAEGRGPITHAQQKAQSTTIPGP